MSTKVGFIVQKSMVLENIIASIREKEYTMGKDV